MTLPAPGGGHAEGGEEEAVPAGRRRQAARAQPHVRPRLLRDGDAAADGLRQAAVRGDAAARAGGAPEPRRGQAQREAHLIPAETLQPRKHHSAGAGASLKVS